MTVDPSAKAPSAAIEHEDPHFSDGACMCVCDLCEAPGDGAEELCVCAGCNGHCGQPHPPVAQPPTDAPAAVPIRVDEAVWIDPARLSGTPCVGGTRVPVYMVVEMVWADGVQAAMDAWALTRGQVLNACWYAAAVNVVHVWRRRPPRGLSVARSPWRSRWLTWAERVHGDLWRSAYELVPDPPHRAALTTPTDEETTRG